MRDRKEDDEQQVFMCAEHQFVTTLKDGELDCHGSPGRRVTDCATCEQVVTDAFAAAGWPLNAGASS